MPKTILLTGATGFLGSHLLKKLLDENYDVVILKRTFSNTWRIKNVINDVKVYNLDEIISFEIPFKENPIDTVIHTATNYGRKGEKIIDVIKTNLYFPLNLLETATFFNTATFLNTDTFFNTDILQYNYLNHYTLSKKHFVDWGKCFANAKEIQFLNLKLEHVYGPLDNENKFLPWVIKQLMNNVSEIKLTEGKQKRDFIYIDDVVNAFSTILGSSKIFDTFHEIQIGTGCSTSIKELVTLLKQLLNANTELNFGSLNYRSGEIMESKAANSALKKIGWKPLYDLETGLKNTL